LEQLDISKDEIQCDDSEDEVEKLKTKPYVQEKETIN
jgi:hypothetical protein